ncbi:MAG TPA: serine hydrolase [Pyrinomonadaceae bacterium]|nr:serine hydrolase [Pyrinomonadaceae bacterium]
MRKAFTLLFVAAVFAAHIAARGQQPAALPDTPAGRTVARYVEAFNTGDEQRMRAFFLEHVAADSLARRPVEARLEVYRQMRDQTGGLELHGVTGATDTRVATLMRTKRGGWLRFEFVFEQQGKLVGLSVEDAESPSPGAQGGAAAPPATLTEAEALAEVERLVEEASKADEFSGVVLVAKNGSPVLRKAVGLASVEFGAPNRLETKFNLGSINKIFTQTAIAQLAERGKLSFDDTIAKHLPDYPNRQAAEKVTIRHLLTMRSGVGDFFGPKFDATPKDRLRSVKDFLPLFAAEPLRFEPGSREEYSNGGYIVLGAIVERITGRSYYDYVREHIFAPAGMNNTDSYETDAGVRDVASGYTREGAGSKNRVNNIYTRPAKGSPAGGGYSTAEDLLKFANALSSGKLLGPAYTRYVASGEEPKAGGAQTVALPLREGGRGVAGGAPGINAALLMNFETGYTTVVMSNYDPPSATRVATRVRDILRRVSARGA